MGYSTDFKGELRFATEPSRLQLVALNAMLGEDCRDHPEWESKGSYIDLELTADFGGIKWNGAEKTYDLDDMVNLVIKQMRKQFPNFGLIGQLMAQGEEVEDRWVLVIGEDGFAHKKKVALVGIRVECPCCSEEFFLEGASRS